MAFVSEVHDISLHFCVLVFLNKSLGERERERELIELLQITCFSFCLIMSRGVSLSSFGSVEDCAIRSRPALGLQFNCFQERFNLF